METRMKGDRRVDLHAQDPLTRGGSSKRRQIALPFQPRKQTLISLGVVQLRPNHLDNVLSTYKPRLAIDIRLSPSFSSTGLTRIVFNRLLQERNVEYRTWPELANDFVGSFPDDVALEHYARYLSNCPDVEKLYQLVLRDGPILLLGHDPDHWTSERRVLVDTLGPDFDLIVEKQ